MAVTARRRATMCAGIAVLGLALAPAVTSIGTSAAASESARTGTVVAGKARFEVLSPTLIRTEYAGDAAFVDAPSFTAIGRRHFARTPYTVTRRDGWLTVRTAAMRLRYRLGSGPFTAENLTVRVAAGTQRVTARPWPSPARCAIGARCEAESLDLSGTSTATDHGGYSGTGFAAGFTATGDGARFRLSVARGGTYDLAMRYANNQGGDGKITTRTLSVVVDGGSAHRVQLPPTNDWDTWAIARQRLELSAGTHDVAVVRGSDDSGNVNIDNVAVVTPGADYPAPSAPVARPCPYATVCDAEDGTLAGGAKLGRDHSGYAGAGFAAGLEKTGAGDTVAITGVPRDGRYDLQLRYANYIGGSGKAQTRAISVGTGIGTASTAQLPPTSSWDAWRTVRVPVRLAAGRNTVAIGCPTDDSCNVNLDTVAVTRPAAPLLAPHAPLGGYRRGLDGVDGSALKTPGLLYQDGWSLLDDSASALWNASAGTTRPRPGGVRQDGYVFGYGHDYAAGLHDLAVLTGPTKLLPRWAYGVWYSEYFDRTADEFEAIVRRARSEGVPLDVLVVDTDFKSPNKWNGWEIDPTRIPDPAAFFRWAHAHGLRTSLNIHPSILAADPKFAAAQRTARGTLAPGSCSGGGAGCHVFDWGKPAQLAAYFQLHRDIERAGLDFWWLDWCCDDSSSSRAGVTPDSWINEQYARDTAPRTGRGFAFSRAYGSLQAGGYGNPSAVPTGPWADKRTTLHFTGDTISDWQTLHFEVGYTPGESVATGNASVSHDIGGHTNGLQVPGAEPGSTQLPADLYARWVQLGTFQPIDRLHSNHSDRLPWQYPGAAKSSATKFLRLREQLLPYTYSLARRATDTGTPIVRPLYLQYPEQSEAYAQADAEYLYGPDVLVAPVTTPGEKATTSVWFPPGSTWTDWFTGRTYAGGTTARIATNLSTMPVFLRSGGLVTTRTDDVANDAQHPLRRTTVTVAAGADGATSLYEDNGTTTDLTRKASTGITYRDREHAVTIGPVRGSYRGQVTRRAWTVVVRNAAAPTVVRVDGRRVTADTWRWNRTTRTLTVRIPSRSVHARTVVSYR